MRRDEIETFSAFFEIEGDRLQRFGTFMSGDRDLAADLAQEALTATYAAWSRIKSDPGAYARRIVVNKLRDVQRRDRVRRLRPLPAVPSSTGSDEEDGTLDHLRVTAILKSLSPLQRAVVVLRFYEDMTEPQIADLLDRPLGTVKSDLHRALKTLRRLAADERQDAGGRDGS